MDKKVKEAFEYNPTMEEAHQTTDGVVFRNRSAAVNHCVANDLDFEEIEVTKRQTEEVEETKEEKAEREAAEELAEKEAEKAEEKKIEELEKRIKEGTATGEDKIAVEKYLEDKNVSGEKKGFFKNFLSKK